MTVLLLRLSAPLQSWGTTSRFVRRNTDRAPSRSGIIGLLAAAQGYRRTDPLEELLALRIGVRIDQPGSLERDFHTARTRDGSTSMPLSYRFYLADAVFTVAIGGDNTLLQGLDAALRHPEFPLFLGRRSCPPAGQLNRGLRDGDIIDVLRDTPWLASPFVQRSRHDSHVVLDTVVDAPADAARAELVRDDPISFDPRNRQYGWRSVVNGHITVPNPHYRPAAVSDPLDPMLAFEEKV